jgi:amino acid adenylation domain-containing protein
VVAGIWAEVLGREQVSVRENFFTLGGHSLLAIQIGSRIRAVLQKDVPLQWIFQYPTITALTQKLEQAYRPEDDTLPALIAHASETEFPLSYEQQRLWFLYKLKPESTWYNIAVELKLKGNVNVSAMQIAVAELVRRHEVLRTHFIEVNGKPLQVVDEAQSETLSVRDLSGETKESIQQAIKKEESRVFDLKQGPLWHSVLFKIEPEQYLLVLVLHHIAADEQSLKILLAELGLIYEAVVEKKQLPSPETNLQYADYAIWQRKCLTPEALSHGIEFWKEQLKGGVEEIDFSARSSASNLSDPGPGASTGWMELGTDMSSAIRSMGRRNGATLFITLLAVWAVVLHRYSGRRQLVIGVPKTGRTRPDLEQLVGFFVNTLPLNIAVTAEIGFLMLLRQIRDTFLSAYTHGNVPFDMIVEAIRPERSMDTTPLVQCMLSLQGDFGPKWKMKEIETKGSLAENANAKFDLALIADDSAESLRLKFLYHRGKISPKIAEAMLRHWRFVLTQIIQSPEQPLGNLSLLGEEERAEIVVWRNRTEAEYERELGICGMFERQVEENRDAIALVEEAGHISYGELNRVAEKLGRRLEREGVGEESIVGVCVERSLKAIVGMLGALKAGGAYLPLEPGYPVERLSYMLQDTGAAALLVEEGWEQELREFGGKLVEIKESLWEESEEEESETRDRKRSGESRGVENLAYVMYTSGSTGKPKGTAIPQRGVLRLVRNTNYVKLGRGRRVAQVGTLCFDASTFEIWGALLNGGRLVMVKRETSLSAARLREKIKEEGIEVMLLVTALFHRLAKEEGGIGKGVEELLVGGEALDGEAVRQVLEQGGPQRLINGYGPTEVTTFSVAYQARQGGERQSSVPIGKAIANTQVYILDENLEALPAGLKGELYIGGDGLARGYWRSGGLTAEKFVPNPFSGKGGERLYRSGDWARWNEEGEMEFLGRIDMQVKVRGYRIELEEIEAVIRKQRGVKQAVVGVQEREGGRGGEKRLVAYVVGDGEEEERGKKEREEELRRKLQQSLPEYMVPVVWRWMESLPLTVQGKVDRNKLPVVEEAEGEDEYVGPRNAVEEVVAGIWAEVLGREQVSVRENFFTLGGHSLLAIQMLSKIRTIFLATINPGTFFQNSTVQAMSEFLVSTERKPRLTARIAESFLKSGNIN